MANDTQNNLVAVQPEGDYSLQDLLDAFNKLRFPPSINAAGTLQRIFIPRQVYPLRGTLGAHVGVNYHMVKAGVYGLEIIVQAYPEMNQGDRIEVFWRDPSQPVATGIVGPPPDAGKTPVSGQPGAHFFLDVAAEKVPGFVRPGADPSPEQIEGVVSELWHRVTRAPSGNTEESLRLNVLSRMVEPGGVDPEPDRPGHFRLLPPQATVPPEGVTGQQDINVTIPAYLYMRAYDLIVLSWGGVFVEQVVEPAQAGTPVVITVPKEVIRDAGQSDNLILVYQVTDEVQRQSSGWSLRGAVKVEFDDGTLLEPLIIDETSEPAQVDVIDLGKLGANDLSVMVDARGLAPGFNLTVGDVVTLTWRGITAAGQIFEHELPARTVNSLDARRGVTFSIENLRLLALGMGAGIAFYRIQRGAGTFPSKRSFVSFIGQARQLTAPTLLEAKDDRVEANSKTATVHIEAAVGLLALDWVTLFWTGTRADQTPLRYSERRRISSAQAGKDFIFRIDPAVNLVSLDGGSLALSFQIERAGLPMPLESETTSVGVGRGLYDLPAPETFPVFADGNVIPADNLGGIDVIVRFFAPPQTTIRLNWAAAVGKSFFDELPADLKEPAYFSIVHDLLLDNTGGQVTLTYTILEPGKPDRTSEPLILNIGVVPSKDLPPLEFLGTGGVVLDPAKPFAPNDPVTLRIVAAADLQVGDEWEVSWAGQNPGSVYVYSERVIEGQQGQPREQRIPADVVRASNNGDVVVHYNVYRLTGAEQSSKPITIRVQGAALPLPIFVEAVNGNLNPDDVRSGATVHIAAAAQLRGGDLVTLKLNHPNGAKYYPRTVLANEAGLALSITVPYADISALLNQKVDLSYTVFRNPNGSTESSDSSAYTVSRVLSSGTMRLFGARYNVSTYRASGSSRVISAYSTTTPPQPILVEWQYQGDTTWTAGYTWLDKEPWKVLRVRNLSDAVLLNPGNVFGTGNDAQVNGTAAFAALIENQPHTPGRFALAYWGMVGWGGRGPGMALDNARGLCTTRSACAAWLDNGNVVTWGNAAEGGALRAEDVGKPFRFIRSNSTVFVGQRQDTNTLSAWGVMANGADIPQNIRQLTDIVEVYGAGLAFAAKRSNGMLLAWGQAANGGLIPAAIANRTDNFYVKGNYAAFVVRRNDMSVETWGNATYGGNAPANIKARNDIATLEGATAQAFSVITTAGQVLAWGAATHGGIVPPNIAALTDIVEVTSTWHAFCARRRSGHVVAWGNVTNGGTIPANILQLDDIVQVVGSAWSFAALRSNGTVVAWGHATSGGNVTTVPGLTNVRAIYANSNGFTALTSDGRVVTWGHPAGGGDSSAVQSLLRNRLVTGHPDTTPGAKVAADNELRRV
ncbi:MULTISPECIES: hypothetical protein [unclassified Pseudomonas]|uniref:RCC1 domain-containing protein n=1 Tax=unclassified Pseudomonas TaxID=196821 RepID=UPI0020979315|nr:MULTISPECIES: hypothetical protein [unclassified Pseudomonas]MCO7521028.1 hypothetical protein [Pseudomonas sp. 1]MCO7540164.1 hypothetical protein [Pseudomonas sp. VA159-2]